VSAGASCRELAFEVVLEEDARVGHDLCAALLLAAQQRRCILANRGEAARLEKENLFAARRRVEQRVAFFRASARASSS
jgi:hypothetical protein